MCPAGNDVLPQLRLAKFSNLDRRGRMPVSDDPIGKEIHNEDLEPIDKSAHASL